MFYPKLFENPNAVYLETYHAAVDWSQVKTMAFAYYCGMMFIGSGRSTHIKLYKELKIKDELAEKRHGRGKYAGRLYMSSKIITFWEFPETNKILMKLLVDIEEETSIHFDNSWTVEVPLYKDSDHTAYWGDWQPRQSSQKFVPIDKYVGGSTRSEEEMQQQHILPPIEKEKQKKLNPVATGFGSDKTAWDSKNNIEFRQKKSTSESLK